MFINNLLAIWPNKVMSTEVETYNIIIHESIGAKSPLWK